MEVVIRLARREGVAPIHAMIVDLAEYERQPEAVVATAADLENALFSKSPALFADVADIDGACVGMAIWFLNYSTWTGRHGIYLEDLYVRPEFRGQGIGRDLMVTLARRCVERGYARFEWAVFDWNAPAIAVYRRLGAVGMEGWTVQRLEGDAMRKTAALPLYFEAWPE